MLVVLAPRDVAQGDGHAVADRHGLMVKPGGADHGQVDQGLLVDHAARLRHRAVLGHELGVLAEAPALRGPRGRLVGLGDQLRADAVHLHDGEITDGAGVVAHGFHHEEGVEPGLDRGAKAGLAHAQRLGGAAHVVGAGEGERARDEPDQEQRGQQRGHRGDGLHGAGDPVDGLPEGDDLEVVRGAAGDDEDPEAEEDPVKGEVLAAANEVEKREGDRGVGEGDDRVGDDMKPDDARLPEVAVAVRHELVGREQTREVVKHVGSRGAPRVESGRRAPPLQR